MTLPALAAKRRRPSPIRWALSSKRAAANDRRNRQTFNRFIGPAAHSMRTVLITGRSVAEWLACWTQAQKAWVQIAVATLSGNSLRQTVHTHRASVHEAAKVVVAVLRVAGVTAGLAESNGSLPPGL